jgi:phosphonate transport system substrate-binding protein
MKRNGTWWNCFIATVMCAVLLVPAFAAAEIKFAVLPRLSATEMHDMFKPLMQYLSTETGEKVELIIPKDFDDFKKQVMTGAVDLGFANSVVYIQLKKNIDIEPLAVSAEKKGGTRFRGIIIARKDSGIETVQDLKGRKLIFVEKDSAAGHVFQMLTLSKAGLDVDKDFTKLPFAMKHDNVTLAVFNKAADAGGIREDDLDKMKDKVDLAQLKIVAYTDFFPNWPVFSTPKLAKAKSRAVMAALLKLKPSEPEAERVLSAAKLSGFSTISDKDYDQLRHAAKLAGAY